MKVIAPGDLFDGDGRLPSGTKVLSLQEFLAFFCNNLESDDALPSRSRFNKPFFDIYKWAEEAGATSMVIGGSFISNKPDPSDIDVLILFAHDADVPKSMESFFVDGVVLDIQLLSEEQPDIVSGFLKLLATERNDIEHGLVQLKFRNAVSTQFSPKTTPESYEIVKVAYLGRRFAPLHQVKGVIIPIHGIRTEAPWLPHLVLLSNLAGWAVAPYVYGYKGAATLARKGERDAIVSGFRDWLELVASSYPGSISIIAHSLGSYVLGRYLEEAGDIRKAFDGIVLCGSILNTEFDWPRHLENCHVGKVLNTISENDEYVKFMPEGGIAFLSEDPLYGRAGLDGFKKSHPSLTQKRSLLLDHSNVIKQDVIRTLWLPFIELARNSVHTRTIARLLADTPRKPVPTKPI